MMAVRTRQCSSTAPRLSSAACTPGAAPSQLTDHVRYLPSAIGSALVPWLFTSALLGPIVLIKNAMNVRHVCQALACSIARRLSDLIYLRSRRRHPRPCAGLLHRLQHAADLQPQADHRPGHLLLQRPLRAARQRDARPHLPRQHLCVSHPPTSLALSAMSLFSTLTLRARVRLVL